MTAAKRRRAAEVGYHARVGGTGGGAERIDLDEEGDLHAILSAFSACSPFGHVLGRGTRFLGYFEPGDGRIEHRYPPAVTLKSRRPAAPC